MEVRGQGVESVLFHRVGPEMDSGLEVSAFICWVISGHWLFYLVFVLRLCWPWMPGDPLFQPTSCRLAGCAIALGKHIFSITVPSALEPGIFFKGPFTMFAHKGVFLRFGISSRWIFHILVKNVSGPVSFSSVLNFPLAALSCDSCSRVWSPQGCLSRLQRMLLEAAGIHFLVTI